MVTAHLAILAALLDDPMAPPPPPPDRVRLSSGETLLGTICGSNGDTVTLDHATLGLLEIPRDSIDEFGPIPAPERPKAWTYYLGLQFAGAFNVNNELNLRASGGLRWNQEEGTFTLDAEYFFNSSNDQTLDNDILVTAVQRWDIESSDWFVQLRGIYQWDQFETWEHRVSLYLGPGYRFVNQPDMKLNFTFGAGSTYEYQTDVWTPELIFGEDFTWKLDARQTLSIAVNYAPDIVDFSNYRLDGRAEYAVQVGAAGSGMALTFGARDIYQSRIEGPGTNNDLRIYGGIRYTF